jgi:hypothetical protein
VKLATATRIVVTVALCVALGGCDFVIDEVLFRPETLASLDAGRQRTIVITRETWCDQACAITFEVREAGRVRRRGYISSDDGRTRHSYSLITAEGGDLVGLVDAREKRLDPLIVLDFAAGRSSQDLPRPDASYEEGIEYHHQLRERLRRENPQLPAPAPTP